VLPASAALLLPQEGHDGCGPTKKEQIMRVLSLAELSRCTRSELSVLLHRAATELPNLREGSPELHSAHTNLPNIRKALAKPDFRPR
jgi:hypothetical protein